MMELPEIMKMLYILFWVVVTEVYSPIKNNLNEYLRSVHFTVYKLYLQKIPL